MRTFIWLSFIVSSAQAVIILSNRKMRETFGIICFLSIIEAAYFGNLEQSTMACGLKIPELFAYTVLRNESMTWEQQKVRAIMILDGSNRFFNLLLWSMSIYINMMLMSDLIMRLISPMEKHETAKKIRLFIMVTVCLVCAIAFASDAPKLDEINSSALVFLSILLSFFYIMAFSSLIVAAYLIWNLGLG